MRRRALIFLVLSLVFTGPVVHVVAQDRGVSVVSEAVSKAGNWGRYHALVIGINEYEKWRPLQTAVKDATVLRNLLVDRYGFDEKNVVLLVDKEATRPRIIRELRSFAGGLEEGDNLLIYYAGHGQLDELTGDGYWVPVEGALKDSSSWVSNSVLKAVLSSTRVDAKNVVVIADSCYSGSLLRDGPSMLSVDEKGYTEKLARASALRSRQVISSGGVEPVADGGRDGHSLFAYYFLKALKENDREVIDLENLFHTRVWAPVTQIGNQRPNVGRLKTPMDEDGQFVLTNRARAREIAEVKKAETEQAAQQKAQLAALMAEKEKLEAERKRLELEKELLDEKKKIEAERRKIEQEKQRLARERLEAERVRLEAEQERAASASAAAGKPAIPPTKADSSAMTLAAVSPQTNKPGRLSLVILSPNGDRLRFFSDRGYIESIENALSEYRHIEIKQAYNPSAISDREISPVSLSDAEQDALWQKKSFFSSPEPDLEKVVRYAEKVGSELVAMSHLTETGKPILDQYLIDVRNRKIYSKTGSDSSSVGWKGVLERVWGNLLASYTDSAR